MSQEWNALPIMMLMKFLADIQSVQNQISSAKRRRRRRIKQFMLLARANRRSVTQNALAAIIEMCAKEYSLPPSIRTCLRHSRNSGWWENVWANYDDRRFKEAFRVTRGTFVYILGRIHGAISKESLNEDAISAELRLAICLYRLARGDYLYTISEMTGVGETTVCNIVIEVCEALVKEFWNEKVKSHFPKGHDDFRQSAEDFEVFWQYGYSFGAVDGCHLPMKCPAGGRESQKEHHNFKGFYSQVLMAIVDARYRCIWACVGHTGNNHDSGIFEATALNRDISENNVIPSIGRNVNTVQVPPVIIGDSAFPFHPWLMKPYTNAVLTDAQSNYNYRHSRARMVAEGFFGQLKGRFRVLLRKCDSSKSTVKVMALAAIVLHNICLEVGDLIIRAWDPSMDPLTNQMRPREDVRRLLMMRECRRIPDTGAQATKVRDALAAKFRDERI